MVCETPTPRKSTASRSRAFKHEKALLRKAVHARHINTSQFMLQASLNAAQTVIADQTEFRLPPEQWEAFCQCLVAPARTIPALRQLFSKPKPYDL